MNKQENEKLNKAKSQVVFLIRVLEFNDGTWEAQVNLGGGRTTRVGPNFDSAISGAVSEALLMRSLPETTQGPDVA